MTLEERKIVDKFLKKADLCICAPELECVSSVEEWEEHWDRRQRLLARKAEEDEALDRYQTGKTGRIGKSGLCFADVIGSAQRLMPSFRGCFSLMGRYGWPREEWDKYLELLEAQCRLVTGGTGQMSI